MLWQMYIFHVCASCISITEYIWVALSSFLQLIVFFCHLHSQILWISDRKCSTDTILLFKFRWFWISYRNIRFGVSFPLSNYISKVWAWIWFNIFWLADNMLHFVMFEYDWQLGSSFLTVGYPGTSHVLFIMTDFTFFLYKFVLKVAGLQRKVGQSYVS